MPRVKPSKFSKQVIIDGRQVKMPVGHDGNALSALSRLMAYLVEENPDHDWDSESRDWPRCLRAAVKARGISF